MSLFERLINNNFGFTTLLNQRRMRSEISAITRLMYPELTDDARVISYPNVRGVDLFFFNH
jgi:hypothetical protein